MRLVAATIITLALTGCADMSGRTSLARQEVHQAEALETHYYDDLANPGFAILAGKVDLHQTYRRGEDPCASIRENRVPTAQESAALRQWTGLRESYISSIQAVTINDPSGSSQVKEVVNQFNAVMDNALRAQTVLISDLADGRLTYCQFAKFDKAWTEDTLRETDSLRRSLRQVRQMEGDLSHRYFGGDWVGWKP